MTSLIGESSHAKSAVKIGKILFELHPYMGTQSMVNINSVSRGNQSIDINVA